MTDDNGLQDAGNVNGTTVSQPEGSQNGAGDSRSDNAVMEAISKLNERFDALESKEQSIKDKGVARANQTSKVATQTAQQALEAVQKLRNDLAANNQLTPDLETTLKTQEVELKGQAIDERLAALENGPSESSPPANKALIPLFEALDLNPDTPAAQKLMLEHGNDTVALTAELLKLKKEEDSSVQAGMVLPQHGSLQEGNPIEDRTDGLNLIAEHFSGQ